MLFLFLVLSFHFVFSVEVTNPKYSKLLKDLLAHSVEEVSVSELRSDTNDVIYLDARKRAEYDVSHIENAVWVGYKKFSMKSMSGIPKHKRIIVYCSVGYRSEKITEKLAKNGYDNAANLVGGVFEWVNQGGAVYNKQGKLTRKVHAFNQKWGKWLRKGIKTYE